MRMKNNLYKLAIWYIGKCNEEWHRPVKELETLDKLTFRDATKSYLKYGMDAEWKNFSRYDVLDNAIQRLAEYENNQENNLNR